MSRFRKPVAVASPGSQTRRPPARLSVHVRHPEAAQAVGWMSQVLERLIQERNIQLGDRDLPVEVHVRRIRVLLDHIDHAPAELPVDSEFMGVQDMAVECMLSALRIAYKSSE